MERVKFIKRIGDSIGIILNKEEQKLFDLSINDKVVLSIQKFKDDEK